MSLGFVDDAKDALREIGQRYPSHPAILDKIAELGLDQEAVEEPPPPPAPAPRTHPADDLGLDLGEPPETSPFDALSDLGPAPEPEPPPPAMPEPAQEGGIDLGAELGDLFSAQSAVEEPVPEASSDLGDAGLAEIFKEFKKGVDKQLGKEDYDTRYNLGIAYKEMGLIDEAIAEFQLAAKDETRVLECSSMLGICFMEKGMPKLAVKWFEKGLKAPGRSEEEYQGLRYDLAMAHEASGDLDKALSLFEDLYGLDATFRDVAQKVRTLRDALPS
jgi:tetratricopeptide (TPR) repeat protein